MTAAKAELVHVRYQKLKNMSFSVMELRDGLLHEHSSLEIGMVLEGSVLLECGGRTRQVAAGGLLLFNPYESHILSSPEGAKVLLMQLAPGFGKAYFARISSVEFDNSGLDQLPAQVTRTLSEHLLSAAEAFFGEPQVYGLECAAWAAHLVAEMLRCIPYRITSDGELMSKKKKVGRHQRIAAFMEQHYREKVTLAQLAKAEGISSTYMSRIFAELFHKPFQEYLSEFRLQKALPLLKNPSIYLVDVCMECGFSDTRYLNAVCQKQYGCTAAQLREKLIRDEIAPDEDALVADMPRYSDAEALQIIQKFCSSKEDI